MPEYCPCCGQRLELEPGFYYGAMYVSYAISVALFLTNFFVLHIFFEMPDFWFLTLNTLILLILWPVIFRYARTFYLYMFVSFDPKALKSREEKTNSEPK
jgi:archaellum biogenesis protein FlaJ (TadC family)